jgi:hypothetical protein
MHYAKLNDPTEGLNAISLCDLVTHICSTYATISQPNVDDNIAKFVTGIEPSLPLAVYTRKQEKCQTFTQDASIPISEATMVTTGTKAALNCGGMELAWCKWKHCPLVDHMWNNWKLNWTAAFAETRDINRMIANNNAFTNQAATNAEQAAMMAKSLDNLANAAIQKNDTVEKLVTANAKLAKALANANAIIARLHLPLPILQILHQLHQGVQQTIVAHHTGQPSSQIGTLPATAQHTVLKLNMDTPAPPAPNNKMDTTLKPPIPIPKAAARPTKIGLRTPDGSNQWTC